MAWLLRILLLLESKLLSEDSRHASFHTNLQESYRCGHRSWHAILQARKAFRSLKRVQRLQAFTHRNSVQKQASNTWSHVQSWSKMQAEIRARRANMVAEGRVRQKKHDNRSKLEAKLHDLAVKFISLCLFLSFRDE